MFANCRDKPLFLFAGLGGNISNKLKIKEPKTTLFRNAGAKVNAVNMFGNKRKSILDLERQSIPDL